MPLRETRHEVETTEWGNDEIVVSTVGKEGEWIKIEDEEDLVDLEEVR